jgi:uncharacterized protein (UPF0276 family)
MLVGLGHRRALHRWLVTRPPEVACLELTAEHFFDAPRAAVAALRRAYPLVVHGLGLSLGTPGPLDEPALAAFARVVAAADPLWISEHAAFTRTAHVDLGHLNPVVPSERALAVLADHAKEVMDRCQKPLLLENIATHLRPRGALSEPEFLNRLCARAGCGLLLDVTNLYVNARNFRFDPLDWLAALDLGPVRQLHVVGCTLLDGRWHDLHAEPIQDEIRSLADAVLARTEVEVVILERDESFPPPAELAAELRSLERACPA